MTSLAPARALHAPRARRTRPHRPRVPRADATDGSTPSRRADDAPIASKPVAVDAKPSASKALLDEVRAALVPSGANAATVLRATQRFQEAYEAGEDVETTVAKAMGFARSGRAEASGCTRPRSRKSSNKTPRRCEGSWRRRRRCMIRA